MTNYILSGASVFAACVTLGASALAQTTERGVGVDTATPAETPSPPPTSTPPATPEPAPPPVIPPHVSAAEAARVDPARSALPAPTIPLADEERADVVKHTWPNRPMLVTGVVVLGGTYAASAIVAAASDRKADNKLYLPVVGPWLDLKHRDCEVNDCGNDTFNKALLIGDGALQGIGAVTMVLSLVIPESTKKPWYLIGNEKLSVTPQVGSSVTGLTASGSF